MAKRVYPTVPIPAVGAIVVGSEGVLLALRDIDPAKGLWSIPGGIIKTGETLRNALSREVLEETGVQIDIIEMITAADVILHDSDGGVEYHFIWILYLAKALSEELSYESPEAEAKWFPLNGLPSDEMPPEVLDLILKMSDRIREIH